MHRALLLLQSGRITPHKFQFQSEEDRVGPPRDAHPHPQIGRSEEAAHCRRSAGAAAADAVHEPVRRAGEGAERRRRCHREWRGQLEEGAQRRGARGNGGSLFWCTSNMYVWEDLARQTSFITCTRTISRSKVLARISHIFISSIPRISSQDPEKELYEKYEICEVLGVGSTSTCHRCINRIDGKSYACKIIDKKHIEQRFAGMIEQFHTEIAALRSLHHPNIITLYDVYITDEKIYIVMELMSGGELFDYVVAKGTLNEEEASQIVNKVTSALVYMHSKNIIHRDLKPENLLLTHRPKSGDDIDVKIIDFGLSKVSSERVMCMGGTNQLCNKDLSSSTAIIFTHAVLPLVSSR